MAHRSTPAEATGVANPPDARVENRMTAALPKIRGDAYIGGKWRPAADGATFTVLNPALDEPVAEVAAASKRDIDAAVHAARHQLREGEWSRISGRDRGKILRELACLVDRDREVLAKIEAIDVGRPIREPRELDIPMAVSTYEYFAGWADKIEGRTIPTPGYFGQPTLSYTVREPIGVVAAITPWNAPTMITSWKLAPALAAGCAVVLKPSEDAPLASLYTAQLLEEAGLPPGVVNIVPGLGGVAGAELAAHAGVNKISFTGSPEAGRQVQRAAAEHFTPVSLELGGKSPQIIFPDADIDAAISGTAQGLFFNQGEVCAAGTRILVHESVIAEVTDGLTDIARKIRLGDPMAARTTMGALINRKQYERVLTYIDSGLHEGATVTTGGGPADGPGFFVQPTVFTAAAPEMKISQDEIFGPVGVIMPFANEEEAIRLANDSRYGLAATIWTRNLNLAHRVAASINAGVIWINGWSAIDPSLPWSGRKTSGIGSELGWSSMTSFTEEKVITLVM